MHRRDFMKVCCGSALALLPPVARAQQAKASYRIGYLALLPGEDKTLAVPFVQRLQELGYRQGTNMTLDYRSAEGRPELLPQFAADMVSARPDILVCGFGTLAPKAAMSATKTIPIVFTSVGDPVGAGLIASLSQPGGNVTGLSGQASDITAKRLQILEDLIPGRKIVAVLGNPDTPYTALALQQVKAAAVLMNQPLAVFEARAANQLPDAVDGAVKAGAVSLLVLEDPVLIGAKKELIALLAAARLPAIYGPRDYPDAGGLISYGPDQAQMSRRGAEYVDRILKGASPASLPVEQPTRFQFVINLRTAKALGLDVPTTLLARADEVIE